MSIYRESVKTKKKTISEISNKERKFDKKKREETLTLSLVRSDDMQTLSLLSIPFSLTSHMKLLEMKMTHLHFDGHRVLE